MVPSAVYIINLVFWFYYGFHGLDVLSCDNGGKFLLCVNSLYLTSIFGRAFRTYH